MAGGGGLITSLQGAQPFRPDQSNHQNLDSLVRDSLLNPCAHIVQWASPPIQTRHFLSEDNANHIWTMYGSNTDFPRRGSKRSHCLSRYANIALLHTQSPAGEDGQWIVSLPLFLICSMFWSAGATLWPRDGLLLSLDGQFDA